MASMKKMVAQFATILLAVLAAVVVAAAVRERTGMPEWAARQLVGVLATLFGGYTLVWCLTFQSWRPVLPLHGAIGRSLWRICGRPMDGLTDESTAGLWHRRYWVERKGLRISPVFRTGYDREQWRRKFCPPVLSSMFFEVDDCGNIEVATGSGGKATFTEESLRTGRVASAGQGAQHCGGTCAFVRFVKGSFELREVSNGDPYQTDGSSSSTVQRFNDFADMLRRCGDESVRQVLEAWMASHTAK